MQIQDYYKRIDAAAHQIFEASLAKSDLLAQIHGAATEIDLLADLIPNQDEQKMLRTVRSQLETSSVCVCYGLYHAAMASLRLSLELSFGCIYFSSNKLAHREWLANGDLSWSVLNGNEGVLSHRFVHAFFPELVPNAIEFGESAKAVYGYLSEFVHGNSETWSATGLALEENESVRSSYASKSRDVVLLIKFAFCVRYLKFLPKDGLELVQDTLDDLMYINAIRECVGGPKEIK